MRHRRTAAPAGRGHRWLAAASVAVLLLSAGALTGALQARLFSPGAHPQRLAAAAADPAGARQRSPARVGAVRLDRDVGSDVLSAPEEEAQGRVARWRAVLAGLDRRRSRAYAGLEPRLLHGIYTPGSEVLRRDRVLLLRYRHRGWRVRGLRMRLVALRVSAERVGHVVLRVTEQAVAGTVPGRRTAQGLRAGPVDTRLVTLRRMAGGGWRISRVRPG